jgi:transposase-like protein
MKTNQPYPEEFKIEAVQQITQRRHKVATRAKFDAFLECGMLKHGLVH